MVSSCLLTFSGVVSQSSVKLPSSGNIAVKEVDVVVVSFSSSSERNVLTRFTSAEKLDS